MLKNHSTLIVATSLSLLLTSPAFALDARTAAVGGSAIANGYGVHGARDNPASLMRPHNREQRFHMHLGGSVDIQDDAGFIETALEEDTLFTDIEREIEALAGAGLNVVCDEFAQIDTTCLTGTQYLGQLATTVANIINRADNQPIQGTAAGDFGVAFSIQSIPVALHFRVALTGTSRTDFANSDLKYVEAFATSLSDDQLTVGDILNNTQFSIVDNGGVLGVVQPEDALETQVQGSYLLRQQFGLSLARSLPIAGTIVDIGVTPKFSSLVAAGVSADLGEQFIDTTDTLNRLLEESEVSATSFTADVGASTQLKERPMQVSVVARNLIKETITTNQGFVFDTTPQLVVGSAYSFKSLMLTGDLALNKAKVDNLETQTFALGIDYTRKYYGVRAGISHDNARTSNATALSLGFSLGPLHIGGRIASLQAAQAGAQIAFNF